MPLVLGLVEPSRAAGVVERLVEDVRRRGDHMTGGDVGFRFMLVALMQAGRSDVLAAMANRTDLPSYGFQIEHGVTALSETWDPRVGNSQNHCMLGHIEEWFTHGLAGINPGEDKPGYQHSVIRPRVVDGIDWAEGDYRSVHGRIACRWERRDGRLVVKATIPANTTATVYIPAASPDAVTESGTPAAKAEGVTPRGVEGGCAVFTVGSGEYEFSSPR
jgi:alpha-L-rhamnosidase